MSVDLARLNPDDPQTLKRILDRLTALEAQVQALPDSLPPQRGLAQTTRQGYMSKEQVVALNSATATVAANTTKLATLQVPVRRLLYDATTDLASGVAVAAGGTATIVPAQNFTVPAATANYEVENRIAVAVVAAAGGSYSLQAVLDGSLIVKLGSAGLGAAGGTAYVNGDYFSLGGLSAGTHTLAFRVYASAACTVYCRCATQPNIEYAGVRIFEVNP